ncbi:MAG TPA: tetratricopeptide repeat protein [Pyrinomonadaceae bacterium]|nr:tetratricopeptide repeat protein [Pyrinomonadaceae bacterium]
MLFGRSFKLERAALLLAALAAPATLCLGQTPARTAAGQVARGASAASAAAVDEGVAALDRGDLEGARAAFNRALASNPRDADAHRYLGLLDDRAGDLQAAARHFAEAARLAPASAPARNNYGVILLRLGRAREAAAEFEASLRADPRQPNALVNLAQIRFNSGTAEDLRAAEDLFARADRIEPDAEIARALTVIALRRGDAASAAAHYQTYSARVAAGGPSVDASADGARARAELGAALLEAGLLKEAEVESAAAARLNPSDAGAAIQLARVQLARKDVRGAGRTLEGAVARGVESAPLYALLAEVYEQAGHPENAIPAMRLAIRQDPKSEKYRFAYGVLLTNAYAPAAAVIRLEEALKEFPDSPRLWFALGLAHFKQDKDHEAARAFGHAAALDPKFAPAYAYLGLLSVRKGEVAGGVALYERALRVDAQLGVLHYLLAEAMLQQPDADAGRVESHLKQAARLDPTFSSPRLSLAKLYMRGERWAEAVEELLKVTALEPESADAYYQLSRAYVRLKRTAEAQRAVETFKRLNETKKRQDEDGLREVVRRLGNVRF